MDVEEAAERVVVAKPVASRPTCITFRSFSELLVGAINGSSPSLESSQGAVSAIRPKTVSFKPSLNRPLAPAPPGSVSSQAANSDKIYKPMAKPVSKTAVSLLANMANCNISNHQPPLKENLRTSPSSNLHTNEPCKLVPQNIEEDQKGLTSIISNGDRPSYDGYNWRKYGQKQVKGTEYPRSYYKCTHPNCPVKKKVERSFDGQIAEVVYRGEHNHSKPHQPPKRNSSGETQRSGMVVDGMGQEGNSKNNLWSNENGDERNEGKAPLIDGGERSPENSCGPSGEFEEAGNRGFVAEEAEPRSKRRKYESQSNEAVVSEEGVEAAVVVQNSTDSERLGDGFRWRKYGQKIVKGNPFPRSYYRCTNIKCNVRKHVERATDDPKAFVTTYEGKHNHEMPLRNKSAAASALVCDKDSEDPLTLSKDKP